jgi:hypothetical protein
MFGESSLCVSLEDVYRNIIQHVLHRDSDFYIANANEKLYFVYIEIFILNTG